jgi:lysophospholipase L1-like esterase
MQERLWRLRIFGDSIMRGILYDDSSGDYVPMSRNKVLENLSCSQIHIYNSSCFGYTSIKGLHLLQRAISRGMVTDGVLLEFGGNDCDYRWREIAADPDKEHHPRTSLEDFESTLRMMISLLERERIMPVLMTLPPIDPDRYVEYLCRLGLDRSAICYWLVNNDRMYHVQEAYSDRIKKIALDTGTRLIDIRNGFLKVHDYGALLCKDGIHPNEEGHLLIWNTLHEHLKELKSA